jgi:hypothetical protein
MGIFITEPSVVELASVPAFVQYTLLASMASSLGALCAEARVVTGPPPPDIFITEPPGALVQ